MNSDRRQILLTNVAQLYTHYEQHFSDGGLSPHGTGAQNISCSSESIL
jgi:hypothetical protein